MIVCSVLSEWNQFLKVAATLSWVLTTTSALVLLKIDFIQIINFCFCVLPDSVGSYNITLFFSAQKGIF